MPSATEPVGVRLHTQHWGVAIDPSLHELEIEELSTVALASHRLHIWEQYRYMVLRIQAVMTQQTLLFGENQGGVVLTGNQGSGKSTFLEYMKLLRISQELPVLFFSVGILEIYLSEGCFRLEWSKVEHLSILEHPLFRGVPLLIDSDTTLAPPPPTLTAVGCRAFPIHASSPQRTRYQTWSKFRCALIFVFDPPSDLQIYDIVRLAVPSTSVGKLQRVTRKWGRNIRAVLDVLRQGAKEYEQEFIDRVGELGDDQVQQLATSPAEATINHTHAIISTLRAEGYPTSSDSGYLKRDRMAHSITSRHLWRTLIHRRAIIAHVKMRELYTLLECDSGLSSYRGIVFESFSHAQLAKLRPSIKVRTADNAVKTLAYDSKNAVSYSSSSPPESTKDEGHYYIPTESNNPGFDSYAVTRDTNIVFQMTVGRKTGISSKAKPILTRRLPTRNHSYFVFVVPKGHSFDIPAMSAQWRAAFEFCVLEIDCDNRAF
ncbi:hypothetical protein C8R47DRAFT_1142546 [Mycena vitilis]|nr:hypothetical protein C8R47DRAFT_1142546 [Mycena vitilis]